MLYFPDPFRPSLQQARAEQLQLWPRSGDDYRGLMLEPETVKGTAIVFHGNAGTAWDRRFYAEALSKLNYRVILAEYPGYGGRPGSANEQAITRDAYKTITMAARQFQEPITLWGESLGAAVVARSAVHPANSLDDSRESGITGIVMITPWYSLPELAQSLYWYLPARWLTREQYNNAQHLADFQGRQAIIIAGKDEIIPSRHSLKLYEAIEGEKQLWIFDGAGHNSWPTGPEERWWSAADRYIHNDSD